MGYLLLSAIIAAAIGVEVSDSVRQMVIQDGHPSVASLPVIARYDQPSKDDVEQWRDPTEASATMTKTQAACHSQSDVDRLIDFAAVKDGHGISSFLAQRIAANECVILMLGDGVRIESRADLSNRVCVLPQGQRTCFWTLTSGVKSKPHSN